MNARLCVYRGCDSLGVVTRTRNVYCEKHYRFYQMRQDAKRRGKTVPSMADLEAMLRAAMRSGTLACPHCHKHVGWRMAAVGRKAVLTIQHDDSGAMRLLCGSCNFAHALQGDTFYSIPMGHQRCWSCKSVKSVDGFWRSRTTKSGYRAVCKACAYMRHRSWLLAKRGEAFRGGEAAAYERERMADIQRSLK